MNQDYRVLYQELNHLFNLANDKLALSVFRQKQLAREIEELKSKNKSLAGRIGAIVMHHNRQKRDIKQTSMFN